jgi:hypothetical protein
MKNLFYIIVAGSVVALGSCSGNVAQSNDNAPNNAAVDNGGFANRQAWGEHLVKAMACTECHTPKKMTEKGPVAIDSLYLSGYHAGAGSVPEFHRAEIEKSGQVLGNDQWTAFSGYWGISYSANITSDGSGIGNWEEDNFMRAIRAGKYMGLDNSRQLLPPMPWHDFANLSDPELKAIFAYLKTVPAVHNIVPAPSPPVAGAKKV